MIGTPRLILRGWLARDLQPFAALCADPEVAGEYPGVLSRADSDALVAAQIAHWTTEGWGYGAVERRADGAFLGMVGLARCDFGPPLGPAVEIGWRLARAHWGRGYATEAADGWLEHGFRVLGLTEIVAFTEAPHARSIAVMRRLGMTRDPSRDFDLPDLPPGHPLRRQALHSLTRYAWAARLRDAGLPLA